MKKTVLITGCSSGFGRTTAIYFANKGWNVIATMRNPEKDTFLKDISGIQILRLDVEDRQSITTALEQGVAMFGSIDVLVNNAGFGLFGVFESTPPEKIKEQFSVNVFGLMDVTRAVLPYMRKQGSGTIINITSGAGIFGLPSSSLYCASKFAVEGFSESLSYELASQGIKVKLVEPGGVVSTQFGARVAKEALAVGIESYKSYEEKTAQLFANMRLERRGTEEQVAESIFEAANDSSYRLRYLPTKDILPWVTARRESNEESYISLMQDSFKIGR
ncbi:short-chain dehydrogenase/reductase [Bdellovibrio bacteriovorus]|uniref:Short-chain dehydrogenase/reductase n=1 Tax=Bdellovibrio bacteriovorus TaxID=959 RepID=A0A150WQ02_BDEBC|nr:SDR family oxidoreductase [Bdellovibrio bacteriovorus]KYG66468.1 short-chain dehydrogenase/reductase [Bdellovibrio bacteriovorus]